MGKQILLLRHDLLPRENAGQVVLQQLQVQGLQALVVVFAVLVDGRLGPVQEIVVHGNPNNNSNNNNTVL